MKVRLTEVMFLLGKRMADICEGKIDGGEVSLRQEHGRHMRRQD